MTKPLNRALEETVISIAPQIREIIEQKSNRPDERFYWKELVACNLGSRIRAELASAVIELLIERDLLRIPVVEMPLHSYERSLREALETPVMIKSQYRNSLARFPYPRQKASYIAECARRIYSRSTLSIMLEECGNHLQLRRKLCDTCMGIGPKQASLFIRNTGICSSVAVLDRHVLDYLKVVGLMKKDCRPPATIAAYEKNEKTFSQYAMSLGLGVWIVDMAIWFVMRVYKREFGI
jgi:N-glycosylase/DNA lyase